MRGHLNHFTQDNFTERRNSSPSAGVAYDPESLLTGAEEAAGLTYKDKRVYESEEAYNDIIAGKVPVEDIPRVAPRVREFNHDSNRLTRLLCSFHDLSPFVSGSAIGLKEND